MKLKLNLIAVAVALAAASSAQATLSLASNQQGGTGNSSAVFVAIDNALSTSLTVDLGVTFASFLNAPGFTSAVGSLANPAGVTAQWNLKNNTYTLNGAAVTGNYVWDTRVNSFLTTVGSNYKWGVFAADTVSSQTISGTNTIVGQNLIYTTNSFNPDNSETGVNASLLNNAAVAVNEFLAASNTRGSQIAGSTGANIETGGTQFLGTGLASTGVGDFGNITSADFLNVPGGTSFFQWAGSAAAGQPVNVFSMGAPNVLGAAASNQSTWTWDQSAGVLTYTVAPVPEPGTYAMLIAGLLAVGFMARRRAQR
jgi:PEP-CTERM motif